MLTLIKQVFKPFLLVGFRFQSTLSLLLDEKHRMTVKVLDLRLINFPSEKGCEDVLDN